MQVLLMKPSPQGLDDRLPICVRRQAPPRRAADAVPTVELDIEGVEDVAPRADGDADAVLLRRVLGAPGCGVCQRLRLGLGLVQLEADLREVVQLGDG